MAKKQFKAESKRLLDLMINSIYTHKEIFLRELVSNASDALDKLAYRALTDDKVGVDRSELKITLTPDQIARTLTISDNGIGMTKEELEQNLGTIARSGSLQFKQEMAKQEKAEGDTTDIIGQFGVGFYSAFMVADHVTVTSKAYGAGQAWKWESDGADGYTIEPCEKDKVGTDIVLHIKANTDDDHYDEYLEQYRIADLVKKYSDYIHYPIVMLMHKSRQKPRPEDAGDDYKPEWEDYDEWETLNSMVPLWQRPKSEVKTEEYNQFYKEKYGDWEDPLSVIHVSAEGTVEYKAMLYIPSHAPYDFYTREYEKGLQLYSSGVLIMDKCADLLPEHFRFVKGVVDSQDFSLNISREMLQHTRQLKVIANNLEKKIKAELLRLQKEDREKYETFWKAFGPQIKMGVVADYGVHKDLLSDLLLFWSSKEGKLTTLAEYKERMPEDQQYVYFACGEDTAKLDKLPQVAQLAGSLAGILRWSIASEQFVTLRQELELLQRYIDIQKIRFAGKFEYVVEVPDALLDCRVPKLILQPLVENAILHGLSARAGGMVYVYARTEEDTLVISVTDDGCGMAPEMVERINSPQPKILEGHLGLYNISTILYLYYGAGYGLHATSYPNVGTTVTARLPVQREEAPDA